MNLQIIMWGIGVIEALVLSPVLPGIINKVKAFFAGRKGPSVFQLYYDIIKLMKKRAVRSTTAGALFTIAPMTALITSVLMLILLPFAGKASPLGFAGDILLFLYLGGLGRVLTVCGAMDTGSSFEGMGASRECQFAILTEGTFMAVAGALMLMTRSFSLGGMLNFITTSDYNRYGIILVLLAVAMFVVVLTECCRLPVDDPDTHLELTMIHEAMILDNSGDELGIIHYAASLKMWILLSVEAMMILPADMNPVILLLTETLTVLFGSILIGTIESVTARYRFLKVPQFLVGSTALAFIAMFLLSLLQIQGA